MSKFEDRLWRQLVRDHGAELDQMRRPASKHAWRSRPRMLAGTTVGLAGIGTAVALLLGAASSSPAFAVTQNSDGTVSVKIQRLSGIAGANQKLASLGIRARAVAVGAGCDSNWTVNKQELQAGPVRKPDTAAQLHALVAARAAAAAKIDPGKIPVGHTIVIATWRAGQQVHLYASRAVAGPPPACLAPAAAAAKAAKAAAVNAACRIQVLPGGNSGNSGNSGSATSGSANTPKFQVVKRPNLKELKALVAKARARAAKANGANSGSSGTTGNSGPNGNSGNSGNSGSGGYTVKAQRPIDCTSYPLPTTGNSGNSGNAGNSGNSGDSGSATSRSKGGSSAKKN